MKNISISKLIVAVLSISAAQLCAYKFTVHNRLNVPINVWIPLLAAPGRTQHIVVPARGVNAADVNEWYLALHCFVLPEIEIAKSGGTIMRLPVKVANKQEFARMIEEAISNNGKVNTILGTDVNTAICKDTTIEVIEDAKGNLVAIRSSMY